MSLGFFSPDSITWKIHSDPSMFAGGIRALLEQALHPGAMPGEGLSELGIMLQLLPSLVRKRLKG
jgi:uncharacterized protein (DUF2236 family)